MSGVKGLEFRDSTNDAPLAEYHHHRFARRVQTKVVPMTLRGLPGPVNFIFVLSVFYNTRFGNLHLH